MVVFVGICQVVDRGTKIHSVWKAKNGNQSVSMSSFYKVGDTATACPVVVRCFARNKYVNGDKRLGSSYLSVKYNQVCKSMHSFVPLSSEMCR
jgi:hypothetical protein